MQVKVDSTTRATTPNPGFRSGDIWYSVQPAEFGLLPERNSVIEFTPFQGNDGKNYFNADEVQVITAAPPGGYAGARSGGGGGKAAGAKKGGYDSLGNQVGNTITNATALICAGMVVVEAGQLIQTLTKLAKQLMKAGDDVRDTAEGAVKPTAPVVQQPVQQAPAPAPMQPAPVQQAPLQSTVGNPHAQQQAPQQQAPQQRVQDSGPQTPEFDDDIPF